MTSKEFVIWLKGFTKGVHDFNVTPKQWDLLKDTLAEVSDEERIGTAIGVGGWGTPNGTGGPVFTTSTATSLPSGSAISYTNSNEKTLLND